MSLFMNAIANYLRNEGPFGIILGYCITEVLKISKYEVNILLDSVLYFISVLC